MLEIKDETFLLVSSDIHNSDQALEKLGQMACRQGCLGLLYAGDLDIENWFILNLLQCRNFVFLPVLGNCDNRWSYTDVHMDVPLYRTCTYNGLRIFLTHGHYYCSPASAGLLDTDFDLVITGHSHVNSISTETIDGKTITFLNPGSPARPRGGSAASYAVIIFRKNGSIAVQTRRLDGDGLLAEETITVNQGSERDN